MLNVIAWISVINDDVVVLLWWYTTSYYRSRTLHPWWRAFFSAWKFGIDVMLLMMVEEVIVVIVDGEWKLSFYFLLEANLSIELS